MKKSSRVVFLAFLALAVFAALPSQAQSKAPAKIQATLFYKLLGFYSNLGSEPFAMHVVGSPEVYQEMKKLVGMKVGGGAMLAEVSTGEEAPLNGARVVYVGSKVDEILSYTQENKALSITGNPELVSEGVTLGIGVENDKAKIILNLTSTKKEGVNWNPAILKVTTQIK